VIFKYIFNVHSTESEIPMVLNPCYMVIDKDGDFVDASSAKLPPSALDHVLERVNRTHPQNAPFRVVKWTGRGFLELTAVS
jgi:hypothetical protein